MKKRISLICAFSISAAVFSSMSSAQDRFVPFFDENTKSRILENTVSATSDRDIRLIPDHILYRSVFRRILNSESTLSQLSDNDIDLIWDLPEHSNARFINPFRETLTESCETISESKGMTVREIAEEFSKADIALSEALSRHYSEILSQLSPNGVVLVNRELQNLSTTSQISYSNLDLIGLSEDLPDYVEQSILASCRRVLEEEAPAPVDLQIRDSFLHRVANPAHSAQ